MKKTKPPRGKTIAIGGAEGHPGGNSIGDGCTGCGRCVEACPRRAIGRRG